MLNAFACGFCVMGALNMALRSNWGSFIVNLSLALLNGYFMYAEHLKHLC